MKEQLDSIMKELNTLRKDIAGIKHNKITVADFEVESSTAGLKELENTMNRLIDRNRKFSDERNKLKMVGAIGVG